MAIVRRSRYAIDIGSHQQVWSYPAGGALALSKQGVLFIAQQSGRLAARSRCSDVADDHSTAVVARNGGDAARARGVQ
jgi:hypothetical protein